MTDWDGQLERELAALEPSKPTARLKARVGAELSRGAHLRRWSLWLATPVAAAACAALAFTLWRSAPPVPTPVPVGPSVAGVDAADADAPALFNYHRLLSSPPQSLDELLDRQAARSLAGGGKTRLTDSDLDH